MGELSFLIELLLNHKLAKPTKDLIAARIKDLEQAVQPIQNQARIVNHLPQSLPMPALDPGLQNSAVQQALAQREAIMRGEGDRSMFKAKPKPAPK